jgi:hypothetical protein
VKLISDFNDYYDHCFDNRGAEFRRVTTDGPNKVELFDLLKKAGFTLPPHGRVVEVMNAYWDEERRPVRGLVVYDDLQAHCGKGKRLVQTSRCKWDGCLSRLPELNELCAKFCTAYLGVGAGYADPRGPSVSWRLLQISPHRFWIEYTSKDDWRSNCGDCDCSVIGFELDAGPYPKLEAYKLFAVDFVIGKHLYAIDFNVAPGIRDTVVEVVLKAREVVEAIEG